MSVCICYGPNGKMSMVWGISDEHYALLDSLEAMSEANQNDQSTRALSMPLLSDPEDITDKSKPPGRTDTAKVKKNSATTSTSRANSIRPLPPQAHKHPGISKSTRKFHDGHKKVIDGPINANKQKALNRIYGCLATKEPPTKSSTKEKAVNKSKKKSKEMKENLDPNGIRSKTSKPEPKQKKDPEVKSKARSRSTR